MARKDKKREVTPPAEDPPLEDLRAHAEVARDLAAGLDAFEDALARWVIRVERERYVLPAVDEAVEEQRRAKRGEEEAAGVRAFRMVQRAVLSLPEECWGWRRWLERLRKSSGDDELQRELMQRGRATLEQEVREASPPHSPQSGYHAPDFAWIFGGGKRYDFKKGRQRDIIKKMYPTWKAGGDGAPTTEAAILGELNEKIDRLRVARIFEGSPAFGAILRKVEGMKGGWALHLREEAQR